MIQFITSLNSDYTPAEQAQMFVEAGGKWIQMAVDRSDSDLREEIAMVSDIAKAEDAFLTLEHDVELVNELKVHGVHLYPGDMLPREARELLGPHAVIGVTVKTPEEVIALKNADIDYVQVGHYPEKTTDDFKAFTDALRNADVKIPVVAAGDIMIEDIEPLLRAGVNGLALSRTPLESGDPVGFLRKALEKVESLRG